MNEFVNSLSFPELVLCCGAVFGALTAVSTLIGFGLERALRESRRVFDLPRRPGQWRWELVGNLRFVLLAAFAFAGLLASVPFAEPNTFAFAYTFIACWFGFEVYYWGLHRLLHHPTFFRFHRYHHESRVTSPLTGYSMSTVEAIGWLVGLAGVPLLLTVFAPLSLAGFLAYHTFYQIGGNVIGHSNVDFFPPAIRRRANSWISHPIVYHSIHHARFDNHYGFGSTFMDRLLGTEWTDWPSLHAQIVRGVPMRRLTDRGVAEPAP